MHQLINYLIFHDLIDSISVFHTKFIKMGHEEKKILNTEQK